MQQAIHGINGVKRTGRKLYVSHIHQIRSKPFLLTQLNHCRRQIDANDVHPLVLEKFAVTPRTGANFK